MDSIRVNDILRCLVCSVLLFVLSGYDAFSQQEEEMNAIKYSMQKRYRPENEKIYNSRSRNVFDKGESGYSFIAVNAVSDLLNDGSAGSYSWLKGTGVDIGWRPFVSNAFRLGLTYGTFSRNSDMSGFRRAGIGIEHNFYLISYLEGFKLFRPFDLYTVAGIGSDLFIGDGKSNKAYVGRNSRVLDPWVKIGLGMQFKFSSRVSFTLSPQLSLYPAQFVLDNASGVGNVEARQYKYAICVRGGLQFDLGRCFSETRGYEYQPEENPFFVSVGAGVQFQNGEAMRNTTSIFSSMRENFGIAVGKWMTTSLGVRLSAYHGKNVWKSVFDPSLSRKTDLYCSYDGLRAEFMMDPIGFRADKRSRSDMRFSLPLIFGVEGGNMRKKDYNLNLNSWYLGLSCAIQPHYYFHDRLSVFLEPRCSLIPYTFNKVAEGKVQGSGENYWDALFSCSLGIEISLGPGSKK